MRIIDIERYNELIKTNTINSEFKEEGHKRDVLGRFASGGEDGIVIKSNELGEYKDIKELREGGLLL